MRWPLACYRGGWPGTCRDAERLWSILEALEAGFAQSLKHTARNGCTGAALWVPNIMEQPPAFAQHAIDLVIEGE